MKAETAADMLGMCKRIYLFIEQFPGIHYRELQRQAKTGRGNLDHHLKKLLRLNLIKTDRQERRRFYPLGLNERERHLLSVLRQRMFRKIIIILLQGSALTHKALVRHIGLSPSSVTRYLEKLACKQIIAVKKSGREKRYCVLDEQEVARILIAYRESFLDKLVDNFVEFWEE
jgi:predicted transcriptional regulator